MKCQRIKYLLSLLISIPFLVKAQDTLSLTEAVRIALQNNHQIQLSKYDVEIRELQEDPSMVGRSPVIELNASYELGWSDAGIETLPLNPNSDAGPPLELDGFSNDIIVAPQISMVLLDGRAGKYRLDQLSTATTVAGLQLRQTIEQIIAEVSSAYLQMAEQQARMVISRQSIALNQDRLARTRQDARYGTSGSLQELQIEVDLKTDSATYRNLRLSYENTRRDLNRLMGRDAGTAFGVASQLTIRTDLQMQTLETALLENNTLLRLRDQGMRSAALEVELSKAASRPRLNGYANISYAYLHNDASFLRVNRSLGPNVGLRLNVPISDGGARRIKTQTAELAQERSHLERRDAEAELIKALRNAYAVYENTLEQLRIEKSNLVVFEQNLENTTNRYSLGTANNTDVRAAQLNLDAARNRINNYRYTIKQAEVQLYLLTGMLVDNGLDSN